MGLLVALLVIGPLQSPKNGHSLVKVACVVTGADLALTEGILARGGREYNPVISNRAVRVSAGALGCAGLLVLSGKNPDKARKVERQGTNEASLSLSEGQRDYPAGSDLIEGLHGSKGGTS
jgi:hypothetical protein